MKYSIAIPVYNSEKTIGELAARLCNVFDGTKDKYEIIFIDDGSLDGSWNKILELKNKFSCIKALRLARNFGQHNALLCGIRAARGDIIITLDDDLQHPPEEVAKLLKKLSEGFDVVYGVPQNEQHGFLRDIASQVTKMALQGTMGVKIAQNVSAFRVFRAHLRTAFKDYHGPFVSIDVLLTWGTERFAAIPVAHNNRRTGKSNYTFRKLVTHAFNMMTGFSILPLQFASLAGFVFTIFGLAVLAYVLTRYLIVGVKVQGFFFLASIIAIFSGVQLLILGLMGEYLGRIHLNINSKPQYSIREEML